MQILSLLLSHIITCIICKYYHYCYFILYLTSYAYIIIIVISYYNLHYMLTLSLFLSYPLSLLLFLWGQIYYSRGHLYMSQFSYENKKSLLLLSFLYLLLFYSYSTYVRENKHINMGIYAKHGITLRH